MKQSDRSKTGRHTGTYALVMWLPRTSWIEVGALGRLRFPRGYYVYIGSAMNGLNARIQRHLRRQKKLHWHVDYLRAHARVVAVLARHGKRRLECVWAQRALAMENAEVVAERFGSSDCRCRSHLFFLRDLRKQRACAKLSSMPL